MHIVKTIGTVPHAVMMPGIAVLDGLIHATANGVMVAATRRPRMGTTPSVGAQTARQGAAKVSKVQTVSHLARTIIQRTRTAIGPELATLDTT